MCRYIGEIAISVSFEYARLRVELFKDDTFVLNAIRIRHLLFHTIEKIICK